MCLLETDNLYTPLGLGFDVADRHLILCRGQFTSFGLNCQKLALVALHWAVWSRAC